mmetsp:Transcript_7011/g.15993  ORF Transcript_7011/g.15993 Transcript_7011/m.15993 type:complete len:328 (+) Transcript_7011:103-1086(+)|eukprot:CAMPEP_0205950612 /NCGR_PEP_ID=MMETSP1459-20131121/2439_1 /ASSEMBLY_ACC=CAM_ASM_001120 /TAXON_ID=41880 /ORGANISM="Pycnococcus provasolii, Strain RCC931" /LENGTH=327 /DNA_ID=CAMNT_0053322283 /DNA_START=419 /DNA_END=1402 /DNA_ORIENTATION=-
MSSASASASAAAARDAELTMRLRNLSMVLEEELEDSGDDVPELPPDACETWTEASIRTFFRTNGTVLPDSQDHAPAPASSQEEEEKNMDPLQPGGGITQNQATLNYADMPSTDPVWARVDTAEYQRVARLRGIPFRPNGLMPPGDDVMKACVKRANQTNGFPFQKLLVYPQSQQLDVAQVSWATGDKAAAAGLDLRYFFEPTTKRVFGAIRFSEQACIGAESGLGAHGGAVQTALDEMMGEVGKIAWQPLCLTSEFTCRMKKPGTLNETMHIEAWIKPDTAKPESVMVTTCAEVKNAKGEVVATAEAKQVDLAKLSRMTGGRSGSKT